MFKGTEKLVPGDIDRMTQRAGGRNNAYTNEDFTNYHFQFAGDGWTTALEIEADRMRNLRIDAKHEFEQEKGAVIAELDRNEDQPFDLERKRSCRYCSAGPILTATRLSVRRRRCAARRRK